VRTINKAGLELIKRFEGLRLTAYKDAIGVWTIGWGHTGSDVTPGLKITTERAEELLRGDLERFEKGVQNLTQGCELTGNEFAALVSLAFNVGLGNFKSSTLLLKLKAGKYLEASEQFVRWNRAGGKILNGLTKRRLAEKALFLK
jgi:lysozyme